MKEAIQQLIEQHKESKNECWHLLNEIREVQDIGNGDFHLTINKYEEEYAWRGVFISQLENIIS